MGHNFNINAAKEFGVNGSIFVTNLLFWIDINKRNRNPYHYHDGKYWSFNKLSAFEEFFPYWTKRQIETIIKNLKKDGAILTGKFHKNKTNHTIWYTLTDKALKLFSMGDNSILDKPPEPAPLPISPNCEIEITERGNLYRVHQTVKSNNTDIKLEDKKQTDNRVSDFHKTTFSEFWYKYDINIAKEQCEKLWYGLEQEIIEKIMESFPEYIKSTPNRKYRKFPVKWIQGKHWNDKVVLTEEHTVPPNPVEDFKREKEYNETEKLNRSQEEIRENDKSFKKIIENRNNPIFKRLNKYSLNRLENSLDEIPLSIKCTLYAIYTSLQPDELREYFIYNDKQEAVEAGLL